MTSNKILDLSTIPLNGVNLIEASAGTGKTYTIANLVLRLIVEKQIDITKILVVTYTEAATKELRERIRNNLNAALLANQDPSKCEDQTIGTILSATKTKQTKETTHKLLRQSITAFDDAAIYTIHGFCRRLLNEFSFESSMLFDTELISDQSQLIHDITQDFWRIHFSFQPPIFSAIAQGNHLQPSGLIRFSHSFLNTPLVRLVPDVFEFNENKLIELIADLKDYWRDQSEEVKEILNNHKGLKRDARTYRQDILDVLYMELDRLVEEDSTPDPQIIGKFSSSSLNNALKKKAEPVPNHHFFDTCEKILQEEQQVVLWIKHNYAEYLRSELRSRKKNLNIQSFDDLLLNVHGALKSKEISSELRASIQSTYQVALIDEFQDTDTVQFDIFSTIFGKEHTLFYIGDPKQSIYSFRGADIYSYFQASRQTLQEKRYTLGQNYRSEAGMVAAVNDLFSSTQNPFALGNELSFNPSLVAPESKGNLKPLNIEGEDKSNLIFWFLQKEKPTKRSPNLSKDEAAELATDLVVGEISRLLELSQKGKARIGNEPLKPNDLAILVLKNKDAQQLQHRLARLSIPAVITKSGNVFHTDEALDLFYILDAVINPADISKLVTALASELIGLSGNQIQKLIEEDAFAYELENHISLFYEYHGLWKSKGFMAMFRKFMADYKTREELLSQSLGERKLTNLLHLTELIQAVDTKNQLGMSGILSWITEKIQNTEEVDEQELRLEKDDEAVQISTVFKSKGLQYPIVFCPFMWQSSVFTNDSDVRLHVDGELVFDIGKHPDKERNINTSRVEGLSDLMRLLYVGLTRSQNRCYLMSGKIGRSSLSSMDYLLTGETGEELLNLKNLQKSISALSEEEYFETLKSKFADQENILLETAPNLEPTIYRPEESAEKNNFTNRHFKGQQIRQHHWGITSYSNLTYSESGFSTPGEEDILLSDEDLDSPAKSTIGEVDEIFPFPKGRVPGTCLHSIFEQLDFSLTNPENERSLINDQLSRYGLNREVNDVSPSKPIVEFVYDMVSRVVNAPLSSGKEVLKLADITDEKKIVEFEFFYPIEKLTPKSLKQMLGARKAEATFDELFKDKISRIKFRPVEGFMRGFIDLVFEYEGKFYILDWKSNYLGASYSTYSKEKLDSAMIGKLYNLQYYIYTVALHKYLQERLPNYTYQSHFGGVFYIFLRGVNAEDSDSGVFFDLPDELLINSLEKMIR